MGVRIEAYAVDLPQLDAFLNTTLADLLSRYQRDGINEGTPLRFTIGDSCDTYDSVPRGSIREFIADSGRRPEAITEEQLRKITVLQRTAREHLSTDNIYQAMWLLEAFSNCKGINFIKQLIGGHRRHWVGSVLQSAQPVLSTNEFKELEHLFGRILRDMDSGFKMSIGDTGFVVEGLPFTPDDDPDKRFGRWSPKECSTAVLLFSKIMASSPEFRCPPELKRDDQEDSGWHEWARDNVLALLQIRDLNYSVCNMLSFIG